MEELRRQTRDIENRFLLLKNDRDVKMARLGELTVQKDDCVHRLDVIARSIEFVEKVSTQERQGIKGRVEELITHCLHDVFDETYSIEFDYGMKRSRTSVEVYSIRTCEDGMRVRRQIDGIGGGVADAISLPLKLIVLLNDGTLSRILITDEPGKHLSVNHVPKFASFLKDISRKLNVQIIMSSHHTCMDQFADSVHEVSLEGSRSVVARVK